LKKLLFNFVKIPSGVGSRMKRRKCSADSADGNEINFPVATRDRDGAEITAEDQDLSLLSSYASLRARNDRLAADKLEIEEELRKLKAKLQEQDSAHERELAEVRLSKLPAGSMNRSKQELINDKLAAERKVRSLACEHGTQVQNLQTKLDRAEAKIIQLETQVEAMGDESSVADTSVADRVLAKEASERRWKKFPWLRPIKMGTLPDGVLAHLLSFLPDNQVFNCRGLSSSCYFAYYNREVVFKPGQVPKWFNLYRAVRLAMRGRVFPRIECFLYNNDLNHHELPVLKEEEMKVFNAKSFPRMNYLALWVNGLKKVPLSKLPPNRKLRKIIINLEPRSKWDEIIHICPENYPDLRMFHIYGKKLTALPPHPEIKLLRLPTMEPHPTCWDLVTKERFPKLEKVKIKYRYIRGGAAFLAQIRRKAKREDWELLVEGEPENPQPAPPQQPAFGAPNNPFQNNNFGNLFQGHNFQGFGNN